jgi:hypothetical protein
LGPLLFFIYINDLPSFIQRFGPSDTSVVLFVDDTSVIINELSFIELESKLMILLKLINEWFNSNMFSLNLDKTCCTKFSAKQDFINKLNTEYGNKTLLELNEVKFLGTTLDNIISWEKYIETSIGKLNKACYITRKSKQYLSIDAFKMICFAFLHSIVSYGLIF